MKYISFFISCLMWSQAIYGMKFLYPKLYIDQIICKKSNEKIDELYFEIIENNNIKNKEQQNYYRFPKFPLFWKSNMLDKLPKQCIWSGTLQKHQKISLYISMYEQDLPPLDPDDKIGDVFLELSSENELFSLKWQNDNNASITNDLSEKEQLKKIIFTKSNAIYEITFRISNLKNAPQDLSNKLLETEENLFNPLLEL